MTSRVIMSWLLCHLVFAASILFLYVEAECSNEVYQYHGLNDRTMATNISTRH